MAKAKSKAASGHPNDAIWRSVIADMRRLADTLREGGMEAVEKQFRVTRLPPPAAPPESLMRDNLERLRRAAMAHLARGDQDAARWMERLTSARAKCDEVNPVVALAGRSGLAKLGHLVIGRKLPEPIFGSEDGTLFVLGHAAIQVPSGVGVAECEVSVDQDAGEMTQGEYRFVPFARCQEWVQVELGQDIEPLLDQLTAELAPAAVA
jgi:hypothetical protein